MPTHSSRPPRVPSYRLHKSGQAFVRIRGKNHYLGKHGTPKSYEAYERIIAEYLVRQREGRQSPTPDEVTVALNDLTVNELCLLYLRWAEDYYQKHGEQTDTVYGIKAAIRRMRKLYGHTSAREFGPLALKAVRDAFIRERCSRTTCNDYCGLIKRMFRWGASEQHVPESTYRALTTVNGLRKGRSAARETDPVKSVPEATVEKTLPFLARPVQAMVRLQLFTGMRPGEVVLIRPRDVDRTDDIWTYIPESHKTEHHDKDREIFFGLRAQEILAPWLDRDPDAYCFSPVEAEEERHSEQRRMRKTPLTPSQCARKSKSKRKRPPRPRYTTDSFRRAVVRACEKAFGMPDELRVIPKNLPMDMKEQRREAATAWRAKHAWTPNRVRHTQATWIRREFGIEAANILLDHGSIETSLIYAERDRARAIEIMRQVG